MGLPLFITPDEPETVPKSAEKVTARSRSSIRRHRTIRRPILRAPTLDAPVPEADHHAVGRPRLPDLESGITGGFIPRIRRHTPSTRSPFLGLRSSRDALEDVDDAPYRVEQSSSAGRTAPEGYETSLMPPVPETVDFQTVDFDGRRRGDEIFLHNDQLRLHMLERDMIRRRGLLTQSTTMDNASTRSILNPYQSQRSLTPPPYLPERQSTNNSSHRNVRRGHPLRETESPWASQGINRSNMHALSPLSNVRHQIAELEARRLRYRLPRMDGLGDRDRSLSPEGDGAWDTILTTLTPDPHPPSVGSSFASTSASAAAAASASASSNPRSSGTSLTTMDGADDPNFETACDIVEDGTDLSDTDVEDEDDIYGMPGGSDTVRDNFWRSYADVVATRASRLARRSGTPDVDSLGGMQRIIRRLAMRESIPDEWWAEAGLSRTLQPENT